MKKTDKGRKSSQSTYFSDRGVLVLGQPLSTLTSPESHKNYTKQNRGSGPSFRVVSVVLCCAVLSSVVSCSEMGLQSLDSASDPHLNPAQELRIALGLVFSILIYVIFFHVTDLFFPPALLLFSR